VSTSTNAILGPADDRRQFGVIRNPGAGSSASPALSALIDHDRERSNGGDICHSRSYAGRLLPSGRDRSASTNTDTWLCSQAGPSAASPYALALEPCGPASDSVAETGKLGR